MTVIMVRQTGKKAGLAQKMMVMQVETWRKRKLVCHWENHDQGIFTNLTSHLWLVESLYNDGKGLQISACLVSVLPPPKAGEKQRSNAKPPMTTKVVYIHEKTLFINGLVLIIWKTLERQDLCQGGTRADGSLDAKASSSFSLEYTIPHTQLKDVQLLSKDNWLTFLDEAGKKPSGQGKLTIREKIMSIIPNPCYFHTEYNFYRPPKQRLLLMHEKVMIPITRPMRRIGEEEEKGMFSTASVNVY